MDVNTYLMLDDVDLAVESPYVGSDKPRAVAGYVNGRTANWPAIVQKWGNAGLFLLSIDVQANPAAGAQCLDIEQSDAVIDQAPAWFRVTKAAGLATKDLRYWPKLYISAGSAAALIAKMTSVGIPRSAYLLWTAHFTEKPHICGPKTCGFPQADATQWTSKDHGASLDASLCYGYFFAGPADAITPGNPVAPPAPPSKVSVEASYRGVTFRWPASPGAKGYDVQMTDSKGEQAGRTQVAVQEASFPVAASATYAVRVAAQPGGSWSKEFPFSTPAAPLPPPPPVDPAGLYDIRVLDKPAILPLPAGSIVIVPKGAS